MTQDQERALFEQYSRGELSRRQLERRARRDVPFTEVLAELHDYGLHLPQQPSDRNSRGVQLIKRLAERRDHGYKLVATAGGRRSPLVE